MRVLIAIGCNSYDHNKSLTGAEDDAKRIFSALLRPEVGQYDENKSRLLLSPSIQQVRDCLRKVLFDTTKIETFTFFFAGHGGVKAGSFYMWVRDSHPVDQSMSALSLADLFRSLNEASPRQSNIMIDACESGGLITDLGVLLKSEVIGDTGTPALTLVATSAQNQNALETSAGGYGTNAILDCIEGRDFVQDNTSVLDLVEIGRRVSRRLENSGQSPVVWGLNLYGPPSFCRNPRYASDSSAPLRNFIQNWPAANSELLRDHHDALWAAYSSLSGDWNIEKFLQVIRSVLAPCVSDPSILGAHTERMAATFLVKAAQSDDPFRASQIAASLAACLLPHVHMEPQTVTSSAWRLLELCSTELISANALLLEDCTENEYALLSRRGGGLTDLYQLPIRIAKILGWAAASIAICQDIGKRNQAEKQFSDLLKFVLERYSGSVVALCDSQAPYWALALSYAAKLGLEEESEQLAGLIFFSLIECKGKLAKFDIAPDRVLEYLLARGNGDFSNCLELVERPIESLTVLLRAGMTLGLHDTFDYSLWKLDGLPFGAYLPSAYNQFSDPIMRGGQSLVWNIGQDVFRTGDFRASWPPSTPYPETPLIAALAVIASLILPDRVAWFTLEG